MTAKSSSRPRCMIDHENQTFHNRTLTLDGHRFRGCRFINGDLRYKGGPRFELRDCAFEGYVNLEIALRSPDSKAMIAELEQAIRSFGFDFQLAKHTRWWRRPGPIFRYHALLPRNCAGSPQ